MGKLLKLSGIIVVIVLLAFGFVVGETLVKLNSKVSAIEDNDNTELLAKITELETALEAVETTDNTELLAKIAELETALEAVETIDNTELLDKIAQLEAEVTVLKGANTDAANFTIMLDQSGKYLSFEELVRSFANKYFTGYIIEDNIMADSTFGDISFYSTSSDLSNEIILARIYMLLQELSQYDQYLMNQSNINIHYSYDIDDKYYNITISIPSPILAHADFTLDDVINGTFGISNNSDVYNNTADELTPMPFDTVLLKELYDGYISNNTFGNNILIPLSN
ncbi:hypothetical protein KHQ81_11015 [Mycoplasmatota bacterium]|nr:hypothetical protein KHQ81_11015 [Mycoplasmatota bacterium]